MSDPKGWTGHCENQDGRSAAGEDPVKRQKILDGARRVFSSLGFDAASMNDITREAGVSKSTLYVYFRSKEELFQALMCQVREKYMAGVESLLGDTLHPAEALKTFALRIARIALSPEAIHAKRTVIAVATRMPALGREFYRLGPARSQVLMEDYLKRAVDDGSLVIDDIPLAAAQFLELMGAGITRRSLFDDEAPKVTDAEIERTIDGAVRLFMAGYGPR